MNRPVRTDALETLGMIHDRAEKRDAIHLAVEPVEAGQNLAPGARVVVRNGVAKKAPPGAGIGIVDPFLSAPVRKGERFWFILNPRLVTSLRHVWTHPDFPDELPAPVVPDDSLSLAKAAVHELAVDLGVSDERLMEGAAAWLESDGSYDGYMFFSNDLSYSWDMEKFWKAYALLTGEVVPEKLAHAFFSCAC